MAADGLQKNIVTTNGHIMTKIIMAGYVIIPSAERNIFKAVITDHIRLTLAEAGCLDFKIIPVKDNNCKFSVYEEFVDKAAFEHHQTRNAKSNWAKINVNMERHYSFLEE